MKVYDISELVEVLGTSRQTIIKYIHNGELKAFKLGEWKVTEEALVDFIKARENMPFKDKLRADAREKMEQSKGN